MKINQICLFAVLFISNFAFAFKIDTHVWVGQQIINDLEDDGMISIAVNGQVKNFYIPNDVKTAILANKAAYLMGNIGPDAVPDVVIGQMFVHPGVENDQYVNIGWQTNDWLKYLMRKSNQNGMAKAFSYGYLGHAAADVMAHTYVNQYSGDVFRLFDGESIVEQRHFVLENYIGKYTPPLTNKNGQYLGKPWEQLNLTDEYARFVRDVLIYDPEVKAQYKKIKAGTHLVAFTNLREGIDNLAEDNIWHEIDVAIVKLVAAYYGINLTDEQASSIVNNMQPVMKTVNGEIPDQLQESNRQFFAEVERFDKSVYKNLSAAADKMKQAEQNLLSKHQSYRAKLTESILRPLCENKKICPVPEVPDPKWDDPFNTKCPVSKVYLPNPSAACELARQINRQLTSLENEVFAANDNLRTSTIEAQREFSKAVQTTNQIKNSLIDFVQVFGNQGSPMQSYLRNWRDDIDHSMMEYVKATSRSMINTMNPDPNASAIDPIVKWIECHHKALLGMPSSVSGCPFKENIQNLSDSIEKIIALDGQSRHLGSSVGMPGPMDILNAKKLLAEKIEQEFKDAIKAELMDFLPPELQELIRISKDGATDADLNKFFTQPANTKSLIMIGDMADRVKGEMYLTSNNTFDPQRYAVAYNSVVMAKLALLDWANVESLSLFAGSMDYYNYRPTFLNLVSQSFASIDGNHQWMPVPPPYPRNQSNYLPVSFTYSSYLNDTGFIFWQGDMREKVFKAIFKGPISPGIDAPEIIGKSRIVDSNYPYDVCLANPFPRDVKDKTCLVIKLIPVLTMLLH